MLEYSTCIEYSKLKCSDRTKMPNESSVLGEECADAGRPPVAYESRKLSSAEKRYTAHEKELLAVVHCLRVWRHYLLGSSFVVKTDNTAVSHFMTQPKLSSRQARWQELLAEFNFTLEYRAGKTNKVADALSRQGQLAAFHLLALQGSEVSTGIKDQIRGLMTIYQRKKNEQDEVRNRRIFWALFFLFSNAINGTHRLHSPSPSQVTFLPMP